MDQAAAPTGQINQRGQGEVCSRENSPEAEVHRNEGTAGDISHGPFMFLVSCKQACWQPLVLDHLSRLFVQQIVLEDRARLPPEEGRFTLASGLKITDPLGKDQASLLAARYKIPQL